MGITVQESEMVLKVLAVIGLFGATIAVMALREGWRRGWGFGFSAMMTGCALVFCGMSYIAAFY